MRFVIGPLHSRRLGVSLGVGIIPHKVCSLDCVYCEVGATTDLTIDRKAFLNISDILDELSTSLASQPTIDYITFSGMGEPTLHSGIGQLIVEIKKRWKQYKLCLITNSTLFTSDTLCREILLCDLIMPSLDAVSPEVFTAINRPHPALSAKDMIASLCAFRKIYKNQMWLEIFLIEGVNDTISELSLLKEACSRIKPDKIHLNSLDRPGTESWVKKVSPQRLTEINEFFSPLPAEIVGDDGNRPAY